MGRPHPSHPFIAPHPIIYETSHAVRKKTLPTDEILVDEKLVFSKMKGLICSSGCMRALAWDFEGSHMVPKVSIGVRQCNFPSKFQS